MPRLSPLLFFLFTLLLAGLTSDVALAGLSASSPSSSNSSIGYSIGYNVFININNETNITVANVNTSLGGGPSVGSVIAEYGLNYSASEQPPTSVVNVDIGYMVGESAVETSTSQVVSVNSSGIPIHTAINLVDLSYQASQQPPTMVIVVPITESNAGERNGTVLWNSTAGGGGGGGGTTTTTTPPPSGGGGSQPSYTIRPPSISPITLPTPGIISKPGFTAPRGLMTALLFIVFYVFYNQKMSQAQALAVSTALTGVISVILWGDKYVASILIIFGVGIALYYVLGK